MFSYKANAICMAGMTMTTGAGVAASHCSNGVRKPGQLINYVRFWPHRWTFAKNRTAHAQTITEKVHSGNGAVSLVLWALQIVRDRSQTLVGGADAKKGAPKIFNPCKGKPWKNTANFPVKIEFTCFSTGLTHNFHGGKKRKRGGLTFLRWVGGLFALFLGFFFASAPLQVFVNSSLVPGY